MTFSIVNFDQISHFFLVTPILTLKKERSTGYTDKLTELKVNNNVNKTKSGRLQYQT